MAGDTTITIIGNLTDDPELKFTAAGVAVANFRVASTPRSFKNNEWVDGEPLFMRCTAWRQSAENIAESLQRGARVVVVGRLRQRSYETQQGERRTVTELEVDEVGPSLRYATAQVRKLARGNGTSGGYGSSGGDAAPARDTGGGGYADDPWANAAPQGQARRAPDHGRDPNAKYDPNAVDDGPPF